MAQIGTQGVSGMILRRPPTCMEGKRDVPSGQASWPAGTPGVAHLHTQVARKKMRVNDVQRIQNQNPVCKECYEVRTGDNSGVCAVCRRGVLNYESLITRFAAEVYIEKPFPSDLELPCEERPTEFDKPKASQAARDMCERCPKVAYGWCLDWGIFNDADGIWGGLSRDERQTVHEGLPALTQGYYTLIA